ncbi:MAG: hypothetical protein ACRDZ8_21990, partial [Acidimicrobiales bacterium]
MARNFSEYDRSHGRLRRALRSPGGRFGFRRAVPAGGGRFGFWRALPSRVGRRFKVGTENVDNWRGSRSPPGDDPLQLLSLAGAAGMAAACVAATSVAATRVAAACIAATRGGSDNPRPHAG